MKICDRKSVGCSEVTSLLPAGHVPQFTSWISIVFPLQDTPPFSGCVCMPRDLVWVPFPHVILQIDQSDHESHVQSTKINVKFDSIMLLN